MVLELEMAISVQGMRAQFRDVIVICAVILCRREKNANGLSLCWEGFFREKI